MCTSHARIHAGRATNRQRQTSLARKSSASGANLLSYSSLHSRFALFAAPFCDAKAILFKAALLQRSDPALARASAPACTHWQLKSLSA